MSEREVSGKVFGYAPRGMPPSFHLSLFVPDVARSTEFFTSLLGGTVTHRDASGYVNVDLFGTQVTLTPGGAGGDGFHFGLNVDRAQFDAIAERVLAADLARVVAQPRVVDAGTALERVKMYVRCPAGYLFELKGV